MLVVEHDAVSTLDLLRLLRRLGTDATTASSGEQALKIVRQRQFDLVIFEPPSAGHQRAGRMPLSETDPDLKSIPVIFANGEKNQFLVDIAFRAGAVDYLQKSCGAEEFKARASGSRLRTARHKKKP